MWTNMRPPKSGPCPNGEYTVMVGRGTIFRSSMSAATPTIRMGFGVTPMNFITGSVQMM